ncbi:MAG: GNAT family N-acetyltransferase [Oscillospiraceae bacterium]|nr:GNAT family N-acetyltransferase [Oscillospiraceae bacterium]
MFLRYIRATKFDAQLLIELNNKAYHSDFIKFKKCPGYGMCKENMEISLNRPDVEKYIIFDYNIPVGSFSIQRLGKGRYYIGNLVVIPENQNCGIGSQTIDFILDYYSDWKNISLITPAQKKENIYFYVQKCGFRIRKITKDSGIDVVVLVKTR